MATTRELALEAAVRFTDRAKYTTESMLKNAETIEGWLNRDFEALDKKKNPIARMAAGYHEYGNEHGGRLPTKVYVHSATFHDIKLCIGEEELPYRSFQMIGLNVISDNSVADGELKFAE